MPDYYELLAKYIRHIKFSGGEALLDDESILDSIVGFTEAEIEILRELDYE